MKILFTGMASAHSSEKVHSTNIGFFGSLSKAIKTTNPDVSITWESPSLTWTKDHFDDYDYVVVGVVPPTSLGANKVYGTLNVIDKLYDSSKLILAIDNPQLWQYKHSLSAISKDPSSLVTQFYMKRFEFLLASYPENLEMFSSVCTRLLTEAWPKTIYPSLPWKPSDAVEKYMGLNIPDLTGLNFDYLLQEESDLDDEARKNLWLADSLKTDWTKGLFPHVSSPVTSMRPSKRLNDLDVVEALKESLGALITPQDRGVGTWWSSRYVQALSAGAPVVTDWRESHKLGSEWAYLAYQIEELDKNKRAEIAQKQLDSYLASIPDMVQIINMLSGIFRDKDGDK